MKSVLTQNSWTKSDNFHKGRKEVLYFKQWRKLLHSDFCEAPIQQDNNLVCK